MPFAGEKLVASPYTNRFLSADTVVPNPSDPQAFNRYSYVLGNPLRYVDPSGNIPIDCWNDPSYCSNTTTLPSSPYLSTPPRLPPPPPSKKCQSDCYDAYETYTEVVSQLGYTPSVEELLYMTADTEYTAYADQPGVAGFGQEGLARTYYSVCYVKDYVNECQCDELYNFLAGYQPWGGYKFQPPNEPTTPAYRAEILITALGSNKDWLVTDIEQITNFDYANSSGWTQGRIPDQPWQWWGPLDPSRSCSKNVKPSISVDVGNGNYFWMLTSDENNAFQQYCP